MKPLIHVAFDTLTTKETLQILGTGVGAGADVIECGGPLIFNEGVKVLTAVKQAYPDKEIVADIKMIPLLTAVNGWQFFDAGADAMIIFGVESLRDMKIAMDVAEKAKRKLYTFIDLEPDRLPSEHLLEIYKAAGVRHVIYHTVRKQAPYWRESDVKCVQILCDAGFQTSVTGKLTLETIQFFSGMPIFSFILGTSIVEAESPLTMLNRYRDFVENNF